MQMYLKNVKFVMFVFLVCNCQESESCTSLECRMKWRENTLKTENYKCIARPQAFSTPELFNFSELSSLYSPSITVLHRLVFSFKVLFICLSGVYWPNKLTRII